MTDQISLYRTMLLIRRFEEKLLSEFTSGKLTGTTHTYIGQEANAVGLFSVVDKGDLFFSNHRCHGHFLAYGGDPYLLAAEILGKVTGLVGGRGGSQHIHWRNFYSNGVQGGIAPIATGMALAQKIQQTGKISCVFLGDGTLGEGVVYESLNMASLWQLPLLVFVENNRIAQTTRIGQGVAGSIEKRFSAFGIHSWELETSDVLEIQKAAAEASTYVRVKCEPACLIIHTYRFSAHSKGDDDRKNEELELIRQFDPLSIHGTRLSTDIKRILDEEVTNEVREAFMKAEADPFPIMK